MKTFDNLIRKKQSRGEKGEIILITLVFLLLGFLIIVPLLAFMGTGLKTGRIYNQKTHGLYAADAGVEDAMWQIKYDHLSSTLTSPSAYDEFDFSTAWEYTLPEDINQKGVNVTIQNVWIPGGIDPLSTVEARAIADNDRLLVTGGMVGGTETEYKVTITYCPLAGESLLIESIGIWLPQGFTYAGAHSLESLNPTVETSDYKGGQTVIWNFTSINMLDFPEVDTLDSPMTFDLSFSFMAAKEGSMPDVVSWLETSGVDGLEFCWDYDVKVFKIISECDQTSVETYVAKSELRQLNGALMGDYYATGNTLMRNAYSDSGHIRDTWLDPANHSSSSTVTAIDEDAEVEAAYLYWTGWKAESQITYVAPLNPEDCNDLAAWTATSPNSWSVYNSGSTYNYRGHYTTDDNRNLAITNAMNLSSYSGAKVALTWEQKVGGTSAYPVFMDECVGLDNWIAGSGWTLSSGQLKGHSTLDDSETAARTITSNPIDLSSCTGTVTVSWDQSEGSGSLEDSDALYYSIYNPLTGWSSNVRAFRNDNPSSPFNFNLSSSYVTSQFQIRFYITGFTDSDENCYLDNISITYPITASYSSTDGLDFAIYNSDTGWSDNIQAFRGNIGTSFVKYYFFLPPQYITADFKIRFTVADCADPVEYVYIDNIYLRIMYPDDQVFLKVNNLQVYYDEDGEPVQGTGELIADKTEVLLNITNSVYKGFSYTGYKDVTELVRNYSDGGDQQASPPTCGNGNGTFMTGHVDATLGIDGGDYQLAHAGWSLIIVYSSPDTYGHQLFLYDTFTYADDLQDLDFDKNETPGGDISGFIIPERVRDEMGQWETDAARITCFVGEGDDWLTGEFIALNAPEQYWDSDLVNYPPSAIPVGYKLWDGCDTSAKNNVWNGLSPVCTADGIDIDTFTITWDSGLISEGDTTAHIDCYTNSDNWNLVFMILSFRSETTTGGSLSYLIRG